MQIRWRAAHVLLFWAFALSSMPSVAATDYRENVDDGAAQGWTPVSGAWELVEGTYASTAIGSQDISVYGDDSWATDFKYHVRAKMNNAATGNRVGAVYNYQDAYNYYEVEIQPVGAGGPPNAYLIEVIGGTPTTIATAPYGGGGPDIWVDMEVIRSGATSTVKINGVVVLQSVPHQTPLSAGNVGLISRFANASFDNIVLTAPFLENFDDGAAQDWTPVSGFWAVDAGTYRSAAMGLTNGVLYRGGSWATNFTYRVRAKMNNADTGNRVGAVYNYQDADNYYEVEIQPVGAGGPPNAFLIEVIGGTSTTIAAAPYSGGGPDIWVDIEVIRSGATSTVKINGAVVLDSVPHQIPLGAGNIGLITRFANASFDDVSLSMRPAELLFWSGFEPNTALQPPDNCGGDGDLGCVQTIGGIDSTSEYSWPPSFWGSGAAFLHGRFVLVADAPVMPDTIGLYMRNETQTTGYSGGSLYQEISQNPNGQEPMQTNVTQSFFNLEPETEDGDFYMSFRLKLQPDLLTTMTNLPEVPGTRGCADTDPLTDDCGTWRSLFAFKTGTGANENDGDFRVEVYVLTDYNAAPFWAITGDNVAKPEPFVPLPPGTEFWLTNDTVPVPLNEWFKLEIFSHRSSDIDGRVWVAIDGQVIFDRYGPNMGGGSLPIKRIIAPLLYSGSRMPIYQWVDDVQIWQGFPTVAPNEPWYDAPYAPH